MARVEAGGNARLLLDFLDHFDGVAVLISRRRTLHKQRSVERTSPPRKLCVVV